MSRICDVLSCKGRHVHTISETRSMLQAITRMNDLGIGCLVVIDERGAPSGMITERDVLQQIATEVDDFSHISVGAVMTKSVIVCGPHDPIDRVRSIMKIRKVRQLPVVDDHGQLVGIVSLGDVNSYLIVEEATEIKYLHDYIHGQVR